MSITRSKRIYIGNFWQFIDRKTRKELLVLIGMDIGQFVEFEPEPPTASYFSLCDWDELREEWQEKIYNYMVQL